MSVFVKEFSSRQEFQDFLDDNILGSKVFDAAASKIDVAGLTLTFTTPAVTITFPSTDAFRAALVKDIIEEANTQSAGRVIFRMYGHGQAGRTAQFAITTDGDVFTGGTAATLLGLVAGTVGSNAIALASIAASFFNSRSNSYVLVYDA